MNERKIEGSHQGMAKSIFLIAMGMGAALLLLTILFAVWWYARFSVSSSSDRMDERMLSHSDVIPVSHVHRVQIEDIQGEWNVARVEIDEASTSTVLRKMSFQGSKLTSEWETNDGQTGTTTVDIVLDSSVEPTRIIYLEPTVRAVCKFDGGRLKIAAFGRPDAPFPNAFNTTGSAEQVVGEGEILVVHVLERPKTHLDVHQRDSNSQAKTPEGLSEGWQREVAIPAVLGESNEVTMPAHKLTAKVTEGWLVVKCEAANGEPEWEVILAKATYSTPPQIEIAPNLGFIDVQYGPYFLREHAGHLRILRERKSHGKTACTIASPQNGERLLGASERLFMYSLGDSLWVAAGRSETKADVRLRFQHKTLAESGGMAAQNFRDGKLAMLTCGEATCQDDGDLLVATRIPAYAAESAIRAKVQREAIHRGEVPAIQASRWLNTPQPLDLKALQGNVVLIDFWGKWCGPCVTKLPVVEELHQKFKERGFVAIGIHSFHESEQLDEFLAEREIHFPIAVDTGDTAKSYAVDSWPTYILIDKNGAVVPAQTDSPPSAEQIQELLSKE